MRFSENDKFKRSKIFRLLSENQIEYLSKTILKISKFLSSVSRKKTKVSGQIKFYL